MGNKKELGAFAQKNIAINLEDENENNVIQFLHNKPKIKNCENPEGENSQIKESENQFKHFF